MQFSVVILVTLVVIILMLAASSPGYWETIGKQEKELEKGPITKDQNLKAQLYSKGLMKPTSMAFLGPDDILVTEKSNGTVKRILNGTVLKDPLLDVNVSNKWERGLLGIAVSKENEIDDNLRNAITYVFLFYTEGLGKKDGIDSCERPNSCTSGQPVGNRLYKYQLEGNTLVNPQLLLDITVGPGADHIGGAIAVNSNDDNIYIVSGDGDSCHEGTCYDDLENSMLTAQSSNFQDGHEPSGRGGILRIPMGEGELVYSEGILGDEYPLNLYYAYGIRNSFGIDFDPVTGRLWDTENGPAFGDEINLVEPGFNSGWAKIQGVWPVSDYTPAQEVFGYLLSKDKENRNVDQDDKQELSSSRDIMDNLEDFSRKGKYSSPEFTWNRTVSPTGLTFLDSDKLGKNYADDLFVGDFNNGNLYRFELNEDRTELVLSEQLSDKIANSMRELDSVIFGQGFNRITDLEVGPDGFLYILSFGDGSVYRIVPKDYAG
jgi:aldose sugar dehydrogenase